MSRLSLVAAISFAAGVLFIETPQARNFQDPTRPVDGRDEQSPEMKTALSKWIDVDFEEAPLLQAVKDLSHQAGVSIVLDEPSLTNAMVDKDAPITLHVKRVRFLSALQL